MVEFATTELATAKLDHAEVGAMNNAEGRKDNRMALHDKHAPFVTAWSGEAGFAVRPEPLLSGHLALFAGSGERGEGSPRWGEMSEERQRRCALLQRCQICGEKATPTGYAVALPTNPEQTRVALPMRSHEPLVCRGCLPRVFWCPRVRDAFLRNRLFVVAVENYALVPETFGLAHAIRGTPAAVEKARALNAALQGRIAVGFMELFIRTGAALPYHTLEALLAASEDRS